MSERSVPAGFEVLDDTTPERHRLTQIDNVLARVGEDIASGPVW
jgi:hypothetical protein